MVIVVSGRGLFDPAIVDRPWTVILDLVDSLSRSYRDRADLVSSTGRSRAAYRSLAAATDGSNVA